MKKGSTLTNLLSWSPITIHHFAKLQKKDIQQPLWPDILYRITAVLYSMNPV